jgi:hypothetical protein
MAFAQLTYRESLRDIETCLRSTQEKLYHAGIRGHVSRNTLAKANELRDWRIYQDFALGLISTAQALYAGESWGRHLRRAVYALDSTTIDLCLALFPWAKFRKRKGAIKVQTLLDVISRIPTVIHITHGKIHDVNMLDELIFEPGSVYLIDRGYAHFQRLFRLHQSAAFFVTRTRKGARFRRISSGRINKGHGVLFDQTVRLVSPIPKMCYPEALRRIGYKHPLTQKRLIFLTNNFSWAPETIAALYKSRWRVELFFKWIKQNLRIKSFYGTTENAVKTQIWIAISIYVLVAILKKRLHLDQSLSSILQVFSINLLERTPTEELLYMNRPNFQNADSCKQLTLFDF